MSKNIYAIAGCFTLKPGVEAGVHIFKYEPEQGSFEKVGHYKSGINSGQRTYGKEKDVIYITHEHKDRDGERGGGGRIHAFRIDHKTGEPVWLNEAETKATLPSDICLSADGKFLLVPHHGMEDIVTKTVRRPDGSFEGVTECDDVTLAMFTVAEDGGIGELVDVAYQEPVRDGRKIVKISHLHNCVQSPDGRLFLVSDKGKDAIHSYRILPEQRRLEHLHTTFAEEHSHPRYGAFHPTLPVYYNNCESSAYVDVWQYNSEDGKLDRMERLPILTKEEDAAAWTKEGASDIIVSPDGKNLYISVRGLQLVAVFEILPDGRLKLIQNIDCQGLNPRGLCLAPDHRFMFVQNRESGTITRFAVNGDGTLKADGIAAEGCTMIGNMQFIVYEE